MIGRLALANPWHQSGMILPTGAKEDRHGMKLCGRGQTFPGNAGRRLSTSSCRNAR